MEKDATFSRIAASAKRLFGPRGLLVCGFTIEGQSHLDALCTASGIEALPQVYAATEDLETSLADLLQRPDQSGRGLASRMPAAIVMSGISEAELHQLMGVYRQTGLPWPLWATLTPVSQAWSLRQLLTELAAERAALGKPSSAEGNP